MARLRHFPMPALLFCLAAWSAPDPLSAGAPPDTQLRSPRFRGNVEMVVVRASVTDSASRQVVGLEKKHFKVFENKVEQPVTYFSRDNAPLSVGIVLDVSESMTESLGSARSSVQRFLRLGTPQDEYFLVTFNERVWLAQDFTPATTEVHNRIEVLQARGYTALYDAVYVGLQKLAEAHNTKKVLLVVTDGVDNSSQHTLSDLKDLAGESDIQLYVIGQGKGDIVLPFIFPFPPAGSGRSTIREIAGLTGGRAFFPKSLDSLDYYCDLIHSELRSQYLLGYIPTVSSRNGKWRKIKVQVTPPDGTARLVVQARAGYFAPRQDDRPKHPATERRNKEGERNAREGFSTR